MKNKRFHFLVTTVVALMVPLSFSLWAADAWKTKKYTEWSNAEASQLLNRSPWANTESVMIGPEGMSNRESARGSGGRQASPADSDMNTVEYTVAWYSSVPIRQAHARLATLNNRATEEQLKQFLEPVTDVCLITVTGAFRKPLMDAKKEQLLKKTFLQVKGKEKVFATDYQAPSATSRLAIFQFPRQVDGAPIMTEADKDVEFVTDLGDFKVRSRFSPKKMIFEGAFTF